MSVRKTRSDKGQPRKPLATQREAFCDWFAGQAAAEQDALMRDMALIQRYGAKTVSGEVRPITVDPNIFKAEPPAGGLG